MKRQPKAAPRTAGPRPLTPPRPRAASEPSAADIAHARAVLESACTTLALNVDTAAIDRLLRYLALLQRWNSTYNLTAVREPAAMLTQHLVDCLAVLPPLKRQLETHPPRSQTPRVLDVGSGGGLPGIVLAILDPALDVTCVDTVGKKAAFIRQAAGELGLRSLHAAHARVEALSPAVRGAGFDVITSRAFASLADFTSLTRELIAPGGMWLAMKGRAPTDEITALPRSVNVFHVEQLDVPGLDAERCIVWMRPDTSPTQA